MYTLRRKHPSISIIFLSRLGRVYQEGNLCWVIQIYIESRQDKNSWILEEYFSGIKLIPDLSDARYRTYNASNKSTSFYLVLQLWFVFPSFFSIGNLWFIFYKGLLKIHRQTIRKVQMSWSLFKEFPSQSKGQS